MEEFEDCLVLLIEAVGWSAVSSDLVRSESDEMPEVG